MGKKTGTSLGGSIVRVARRRWPDKNIELCPICKATRRNLCQTKNGRILYTTHTSKKI